MSQVLQQIYQNKEQNKVLTNYLRKEHFSLGYEQQLLLQSQNQRSFKTPTRNPFQQNIMKPNDPRMTHYILGTDEASQLFKSTAQESYKYPINSQLPLNQFRNLQEEQHIVMGHNQDSEQSNYKRDFGKKQVGINQVKLDILSLKKDNCQLGDRTKAYYESSYKSAYLQNMDLQKKNSLQFTKNDIRKSNFLLGNQIHEYKSESKAEFDRKLSQGPPDPLIQDKFRSHSTILGTDKQIISSQSRDTYQKHAVFKDNEQSKQRVRYFKSTHYNLGNDQNLYQSEMNNKFNKHDLNNQQINIFSQFNTNVQLGKHTNDTNSKDRYTSTYQNQFQPKVINTVKSNKIDGASSIVIGAEIVPDQYVSEQKRNFYNKLDSALIKSLDNKNMVNYHKLQHYELGKDKIVYQTQGMDTYNKSQNNVIQKFIIQNDSKKNNFDIGNQKNDWKTTKIKDNEVVENLPVDQKTVNHSPQAEDIRSHHFKLGTDKNEYLSVMKGAHFDWTKN